VYARARVSVCVCVHIWVHTSSYIVTRVPYIHNTCVCLYMYSVRVCVCMHISVHTSSSIVTRVPSAPLNIAATCLADIPLTAVPSILQRHRCKYLHEKAFIHAHRCKYLDEEAYTCTQMKISSRESLCMHTDANIFMRKLTHAHRCKYFHKQAYTCTQMQISSYESMYMHARDFAFHENMLHVMIWLCAFLSSAHNASICAS
jgi:hypothetical protein